MKYVERKEHFLYPREPDTAKRHGGVRGTCGKFRNRGTRYFTDISHLFGTLPIEFEEELLLLTSRENSFFSLSFSLSLFLDRERFVHDGSRRRVDQTRDRGDRRVRDSRSRWQYNGSRCFPPACLRVQIPLASTRCVRRYK